MPFDNTTTLVVEVFKMAERSDSCSGETLLTSCAKKEEAAEKDNYRLQTTDYRLLLDRCACSVSR